MQIRMNIIDEQEKTEDEFDAEPPHTRDFSRELGGFS